jgi:hypothetical protein
MSGQADGHKPEGEAAAEEPHVKPDEPKLRYQVVPYAERQEDDLYAYRKQMDQPPPAPPTTNTQQAAERESRPAVPLDRKTMAIFAAVGIAALLLIAIVVSSLLKQATPPPITDLGTHNLDGPGLSGHLIARWVGGAQYQLYIDPLSPDANARFGAVASNPPHPLTVSLRLKDASNALVCSKEILFPFPALPETGENDLRLLLARQTPSGDAVQNVAAPNGQIDEIEVDGPLPCSAKQMLKVTGWEFLTNFPSPRDQAEWLAHLQHEQNEAIARRLAKAKNKQPGLARVKALPAAIEGDDVIVGDNPSLGTVQTGAGRTFLLVGNGMTIQSQGWQVFPAAIHFKCDKNAACVLSRPDASTSLQAHLMR